MGNLVSIIIPTYNRSHLIGETLDSTIAQTYQDWECIIVDDGSTDYTDELMEFYSYRDNRIKYYHREKDMHKGANTCRNYGYEKSKGDYIIWFDSDDIMLPQKLEQQVLSLTNTSFDFSVSKFDNLIDGNIKPELGFKRNFELQLNGDNYLKMKVFWITNDVLIRRKIIGDVRFDEILLSGQEYNFFSKLFLFTKAKGIYIKESLSLHRIHSASIQSNQKINSEKYLNNKYLIFYRTFIKVSKFCDRQGSLFLLKNCQSFSFRLAQNKNRIPYFFSLVKILLTEIGVIKTFYFINSVCIAYIVGKGFKILKLSYPNNSY